MGERMSRVDERLHELKDLVSGKNSAEDALNELLARRRELEKKVWELNYARISEQEDVDRLEDRSIRTRLVNFLKKTERDEYSEVMELKAATEKHEAARQELKELDLLIARKQDELNRIEDAEVEYERLIQEKAEAIEGAAAEKIRELRNRIADRENREQNISEAIQAGRSVRMIVVETRDKLNAAIDICVPVFNPNIRMSRSIRRGAVLREAQEQLSEFTVRLRRFRSELADVRKVDERSLQIGEPDVYENRMRNLRNCRNRVLEIDRVVNEILNKLESDRNQLIMEVEEVREQLKATVLETKA